MTGAETRGFRRSEQAVGVLLPVVAALCAFTLVAYGAAAFTFRWARTTESVWLLTTSKEK